MKHPTNPLKSNNAMKMRLTALSRVSEPLCFMVGGGSQHRNRCFRCSRPPTYVAGPATPAMAAELPGDSEAPRRVRTATLASQKLTATIVKSLKPQAKECSVSDEKQLTCPPHPTHAEGTGGAMLCQGSRWAHQGQYG